MQKLVLAATFFGLAGGLTVLLPALLLSLVLRRFFNRRDSELDEPQEQGLILVFPGARQGISIDER